MKAMMIVVLATAVIPICLSSAKYVSPYPICAATVFDYMGFLDIPAMLYNCSKNIPASLDPPRFLNNLLK